MRRWRYLLFLLVMVGLSAALLYQPLVEAWVLREARRNGVRLRLGGVDLGWSQLVLRDCAFELDGAPQLKGHVQHLVLDHHRGSLRGMHANGVNVAITGSAGMLAVQLGEWTAHHPSLVEMPVSARGVVVRWRTDADGDDWLRIEGARVTPSADGGAELDAASATVMGVRVGPVGARWGGRDDTLTFGVGQSDLERAPVLVVVRRGDPHRATVTLHPTPLAELAGPLGVALPIAGVTAQAVVQLRFDKLWRGPVTGTLSATLVGYTPPLPRELRSFVLGDTSELSSDFAVSADRRRVALQNTQVKHGAMVLRGDGAVERAQGYARVKLKLTGAVRCTALAAAAARSHLGPRLGALLGGMARSTMQGSVAITLALDADSRDLAAAKLTRSVGIGCGLVSLRKLPGWPAGDGLPDLRSLPDLGELPSLP